MIYKIKWLEEARLSLDDEMEYVLSEFGKNTLAKVYNNIIERVAQLEIFPRIGVRREDLDYHGYEIRMLHIKKVSLVYSIVEDSILILYVWNNRQDPKELASTLPLTANPSALTSK